MSSGVFITGTDTGIGKTLVSCALVRGLAARQMAVVGMKPVASGSHPSASGLRNADAEALITASEFRGGYTDINPYAFADPIAPHLAARDSATSITLEHICTAHARLAVDNRFVVIEGVGGWLAPLGDTLMQADLVRALQVPVVLVIGMRLGCISHALLTARAIAADGCQLIGWIANRVDPSMLRFEDNVESIRQRIQAPLLGIMDHVESPCDPVARHDLDAAIEMLFERARQTHRTEQNS